MSQLRQSTCTDPIKVCHFTKVGWPKQYPVYLKPFANRQHKLTIEADCLLWGMRVVVPEKLRKRVLNELHLTHSGMSQMKAVARSHVWWPGLDKAIEDLIKTCSSCQQTRSLPAKSPLHPWEWPLALGNVNI